jgi:hypothetical protein
MANHFTENAGLFIDKDKIREWLLNSLNNNPDAKFYLLVDNFNDGVPEIIKNEIIELVDIFKGTNRYVLYSTDEYNYEKLAYLENRKYKSIIGEKSKILKLEELNDKEYDAGLRKMFEQYRVVIEHGGQVTPEYREPRVLRHLAALFTNEENPDRYCKIPAVPDYDTLRVLASNPTYTNEVRSLYKKITQCFLEEREERRRDGKLHIMASGSGAVTESLFRRRFPDAWNDLLKSSFVVLRRLDRDRMVIYPTIHEMIAISCIDEIINAIKSESAQGKGIKELCDLFIDLVTPIPYADIVGAGVLLQLGYNNEVAIISELVQELLAIPPRYEKITKGTRTALYDERFGHIQLNFEDDMDEGFVSDYLPFAILSQLGGYPLQLVGNTEYAPYAFHLYLIYTVGSSPHFIRRADARSLQHMKPFQHFDWDGVGVLVSGRDGIVEPIVQSIQKCFMKMPDEVEVLWDRAFNENNFVLVWRIYLALREMVNITDPDLAARAAVFKSKFDPYFNAFMADFLSKDIEDPVERERIHQKLLAFKAG